MRNLCPFSKISRLALARLENISLMLDVHSALTFIFFSVMVVRTVLASFNFLTRPGLPPLLNEHLTYGAESDVKSAMRIYPVSLRPSRRNGNIAYWDALKCIVFQEIGQAREINLFPHTPGFFPLVLLCTKPHPHGGPSGPERSPLCEASPRPS